MTHLDVSFTTFAANVCSLYFNEHLSDSARLTQDLRDSAGQEWFMITTHPWILLEFFGNMTRRTTDRPPAFIWHHSETSTELLVMMYNKPSAITPCSVETCNYSGDVL